MKLLLLLTIAGLGLAEQTAKPAASSAIKFVANPSLLEPTVYLKNQDHRTVYIGSTHGGDGFRLLVEAAKGTYTIADKDGKPLVRCTNATQSCEVIK